MLLLKLQSQLKEFCVRHKKQKEASVSSSEVWFKERVVLDKV